MTKKDRILIGLLSSENPFSPTLATKLAARHQVEMKRVTQIKEEFAAIITDVSEMRKRSAHADAQLRAAFEATPKPSATSERLPSRDEWDEADRRSIEAAVKMGFRQFLD